MKFLNLYGSRYCLTVATLISLCLVLFTVNTGCKKLVDVPAPATSISSADVFNSNSTAAAVLTGLYTNMSGGSVFTGGNSISVLSGLSSDELTLLSGTTGADLYYYTNSLTSTNVGGSDFWTYIYPDVYVTNAAIEGLTSNSSLTPAVQQQLLGEAYFMRAFFYFYLVNMYGNVPLVTGINSTVNQSLSRSPQAQIYQQIISDLKTAEGLLSANYLDATILSTTSQKVRPTKWAAEALLARVYLYYGNVSGDASNYTAAITQASEVIGNTGQFSLDTLNGVFLANSNEAIWQLQPVTTGTTNTQDAYFFIPEIISSGINPPTAYLSNYLVNSFEAGDERKTDWVGSAAANGVTYYYPYKYKVNAQNAPVTEYLMVLRLGEQYLIRAEAEANGGQGGPGAITDLNTIRTRAGLPNYTGAASGPQMLAAILHERQVELFTEWGHRWFDLKRTGNSNAVMGSPGNVCRAKGGSWNTDWQLYPIVLTELQHDPFLKQNPGY